MLTNIEVSKQRGYKARWSPEEDEVLVRAWREFLGPSGHARKGHLQYLAGLFPHRSIHSLRRHKALLVKRGLVPRRWQRREIIPLSVTDGEAQYLAAMLDGEGSISLSDYVDGRRAGKRYVGKTPSVVVCYNNDEGILAYVESLLPVTRRCKLGKLGDDSRGVRTNKQVYCLYVNGYPDIQQVLTRLLPYMRHTEKRIRAQRVLEYVTSRLEAAKC